MEDVIRRLCTADSTYNCLCIISQVNSLPQQGVYVGLDLVRSDRHFNGKSRLVTSLQRALLRNTYRVLLFDMVVEDYSSCSTPARADTCTSAHHKTDGQFALRQLAL